MQQQAGTLHMAQEQAAETGAIGRAWKAAGFERGYGYPVTDEIRTGTTVYQRFSNGYRVNWSPATGQVWVTGW